MVENSLYSIPLYDTNCNPNWRETSDFTGLGTLPLELTKVEIGQSVLIVGYPLNFHNTLHNLPVIRHAIIASSFHICFQGNGYVLTDLLLYRGSSGSPVIMRTSKQISGRKDFTWLLLGIHSARLGAKRDVREDDRLNLFVTCYSDILLKLSS